MKVLAVPVLPRIQKFGSWDRKMYAE